MQQTLIQLQQDQNAMLQDQAAIRQSLQSLTTETRRNYAATAKVCLLTFDICCDK